LDYIQSNYQHFVDAGLLMPNFLCNANMSIMIDSLRNLYNKNFAGIRSIRSYDEVLASLHIDVQRARHEYMTLNLASALEGFQLYIPAFLDFRGRIYRSGLLHYHERDLVRSLLLFDKEVDDKSGPVMVDGKGVPPAKIGILAPSTAFHYNKFTSYKKAINWYSDEYEGWGKMKVSDFIKLASGAKNPFQFISFRILLYYSNAYSNCLPITQDASSSAYQIMSFLLVDSEMAKYTNLIADGETDCICDIYQNIASTLKDYIEALPGTYKKGNKTVSLSNELKEIVCNVLDRKLVKSIFMPIIYGKTLMSTASDLRKALSMYLTKAECFILADICFDFWRIKFPLLGSLIKLTKGMGWIASARGRPVVYENDYYTTIQKYMKMDPVNVWIYDKKNKKRRQVTLRVSTDQNDKRKTETSTFVNYIHQIDANIAMNVVMGMQDCDSPVYTVHDNFISTVTHCERLPLLYKECFLKQDPLSIINRYIYNNVMKPFGSINALTQEEKRILGLLQDNSGCVSIIIPISMLLKYLNQNKPTDLKKKIDIETWDGKIENIMSSYMMYIAYICEARDPWVKLEQSCMSEAAEAVYYETLLLKYQNNISKFKEKMAYIGINYSLHY